MLSGTRQSLPRVTEHGTLLQQALEKHQDPSSKMAGLETRLRPPPQCTHKYTSVYTHLFLFFCETGSYYVALNLQSSCLSLQGAGMTSA